MHYIEFALLTGLAGGVILLYALTPDARITRFIKMLFSKRRWQAFLHPEFQLPDLQKEIGDWTAKTFVTAGRMGAANHLVKEAEELREYLQAIITYKEQNGEEMTPLLQDLYNELDMEIADVLILALDIAHFQKRSALAALLIKHEINKKRKWNPPDANGIQQHIEEGVQNHFASTDDDKFLTEAERQLKKEKASLLEAGVTITTTMKEIPLHREAGSPQFDLKTGRLIPGSGEPFAFLSPAKRAAVMAERDATLTDMLSEVLDDSEALPPLPDREGGMMTFDAKSDDQPVSKKVKRAKR